MTAAEPVGGSKSAAAWHGATEQPHADLIARLSEAADWVFSNPEAAQPVMRDALAALADTVPRAWYDDMERRLRQAQDRAVTAERERDEARAERDALAAKLEQVREEARGCEDVPAVNIDLILDTAPSVSLARHDAEVWDEGAEYAVGYSVAPLYDNPYREGADL